MRTGLLLTAALAMAAASALADDKPSRRAKPAEKRVNPCASIGPGFMMLPGTSTCVRVGGTVGAQISSGPPQAPNPGAR